MTRFLLFRFNFLPSENVIKRFQGASKCKISLNLVNKHFVKSVRIWSFLVRIFPHSDWMQRDTGYGVSLRNQSKSRKIRTRKLQILILFTKYIFRKVKLNKRVFHQVNCLRKFSETCVLKNAKECYKICNRFINQKNKKKELKHEEVIYSKKVTRESHSEYF